MSNQDKPLETNDNQNESLDNSGVLHHEDSADLWSEEAEAESVTEFISAKDTSFDESPVDLEQPQTTVNKVKKTLSDDDFDNIDFRNPPETEVAENLPEQFDEGAIAPAATDEIVLEEPALVDSIEATTQNQDIDVEEIGINSLDELDLALGNSDDIALENLDDNLASLDELEEIELNNLAEINLYESTVNLDRSENLELNQLEDLAAVDGLDEPALDNLEDNLDNLLDIDASGESLDALVLDGNNNLEAIETSLDEDLELSQLDSLLGENTDALSEAVAAVAPSPPQQFTAKPKQQVADPSPANKAQAFDQTMRVSVRKLDDLNNLIGELVVKRNRLEDDQERLRRFLDNLLGHVQSLGEAGAKMHDLYERSLLEGALIASRQSRANSAVAAGGSGKSSFVNVDETPQEEGLDALEMDRFNGFHLLSQDIIELIVRVREAASDIQFVVDETDKVAQTFRQVTSQLQDGMNSSRMVAFGQTADRLPRAIRDISRKQKKQTNLNVEGKDVLIDKMIVENLYNPMTHLVNNAISHGIETPAARLKKGKPEVGNLNIRAFIQGNQTVITVTDDGAGIDPEIVKQKAIEKNLVTWATAQNLSDQQVYELLFHPGFSTKDTADDFAGRGVGMDVVNTDLKKIRGSISTESEVGKGTTFTIRLPLVLSICKALTCVNDNTAIAFPIDGVEDTKEYLPSDIQTNINGVRCISWKNALLPLRPLNSLLNYNRKIRRAGIYNANQDNDDTISVVILRSLDNLLAVEVDEVKAEQEIVIKQIDGAIPKPPGIAGATVLGDGTIMPIGDVLELIEIAQGKRTIEIGFDILAGEAARKQSQVENIQQEPMVLVVDDSITVRELLSMSFNKLGYRVEQARDGQEAWDKLRGGLVCDMIFSDIEMPRMNGLELLSNLHKDESLRSIPVAMLTSRGADKHRQIANDLGAKAYLTKPYTEKDLMDVAQHLIEINRANQEAESVTVNFNRVKKNNVEADFEAAPLVLIIDDSVTVRELLSMTFKKAGYRVEQARDGQEAWDKLNEGLECDIAFCDIEMPRMNGLELLSQLQKDEKLASLPIAMLTSRGAKKMRNIAASRGANGYFVKPYVEDDLLQAAKQMMAGEMLIQPEDD